MELPAALSRAPTRPQAWAVEGACPESRHHAEADTGPPPPRSPAFYSSVFAQIEEIGWERLVSSTGYGGVSCLTFRVLSVKHRCVFLHAGQLAISDHLPGTVKRKVASCIQHFFDRKYGMTLSEACNILLLSESNCKWMAKDGFIYWRSCCLRVILHAPLQLLQTYLIYQNYSGQKNSKLKDIFSQFQEILQEFWATMDEIDKVLWVIDPTKPTYAMSHRRIALGDDCYILLNVDARKPSSLPECRFLGTDGKLEQLIRNWRKKRKKWNEKKKFHENLAAVLDVALPAPLSISTSNDDDQADCGICYAKHLPVDDELGTQSRCATDYTCENTSCHRAFHSLCLRDWLRSITTTRQYVEMGFLKMVLSPKTAESLRNITDSKDGARQSHGA